VIVVDTSVIYALLDRNDTWHEATTAWYRAVSPSVATTPLVLAEVDHLALTRAGVHAAAAWRADVAAGAYAIEWWPGAAREAAMVAEQYEGLGLGLADGSLVALAARLGTTVLATFDERHFRVVRPLVGGDAFTLVPRDATMSPG
jgi:predicted nucleic acid-binding protein